MSSGRNEAPLEILLVSGIWPPDVGGPASHGPAIGRFLQDRGHHVRAVTTAEHGCAIDPGFPMAVARRDRPLPLRLPAAAFGVLAAARGMDVIYAIGMYGRSALASRLLRIP